MQSDTEVEEMSQRLTRAVMAALHQEEFMGNFILIFQKKKDDSAMITTEPPDVTLTILRKMAGDIQEEDTDPTLFAVNLGARN